MALVVGYPIPYYAYRIHNMRDLIQVLIIFLTKYFLHCQQSSGPFNISIKLNDDVTEKTPNELIDKFTNFTFS